MRRVRLPAGSPRGGLLTMGSLLVVTSNPTRTSPVKRGQFILDNILGMPAPPPPANIPPLEDSEKGFTDRQPTFRQVLALHRDKPLCSSCHSRMDPLGLSLENFNALGMFREKERNQTIDASGTLLTGEEFHDASDLKRIIKNNHIEDFYRCLTEKMLTYALGRGMEYYDTEAVDRIVSQVKKEDGRFSALLMGIVQSVPFQERRNNSAEERTHRCSHDHSPLGRSQGTAGRSSKPPPLSARAGRVYCAADVRIIAPSPTRGCQACCWTCHNCQRRTTAHCVRVLPQRRHPGDVVAARRGKAVRAGGNHAAAGRA